MIKVLKLYASTTKKGMGAPKSSWSCLYKEKNFNGSGRLLFEYENSDTYSSVVAGLDLVTLTTLFKRLSQTFTLMKLGMTIIRMAGPHPLRLRKVSDAEL